MYAHNALIYLFTQTMRQHSCLGEETSTEVIYCYNNNVPNNTSIFEHWSVLTVYWQWWFEETWKRHIWIWTKLISAHFPKLLRSILQVYGRLDSKTPNWVVNSFSSRDIKQVIYSSVSWLYHNNCGCRTPRLTTKKGTSVEKTTHYKRRQDVSSSQLSPWGATKHKNLVPLVRSKCRMKGDN